MSNEYANGEYTEEQLDLPIPQTTTYKITTNNGQVYTSSVPLVSGTTTQTFTFPTMTTTSSGMFHPYPYTNHWGDERKSIPNKCRCDKDMAEPHEDHIYIKKMWFCSITCYEGYLVACIGENIDEPS